MGNHPFGSAGNLSDSDASDASEDPDGDFLNNLAEFQSGTSPNDGDSDDDGLSDFYNQGLECFWRFSESTGSPSSTANAVSGGPALTLNGATIASGGLFGNALKPVYYTNNVPVAAVVLNGAMEWSFSGWFKMDTVQSNNVFFSAKAKANATNIIGASISGSTWGNMTLYVTLNGSTFSATVNIASGSGFHHLAVIRNQQTNKAEVYFDGTLLTAGSITYSPEPLNLASGQFRVSTVQVPYSSNNYYLYGSMDDVRLYHRRLQATDVNALYVHGCTSSAAAKYWTLSYLLNNPSGQGDADSDGFTNLAEVIAGSDPESSSSKPVAGQHGIPASHQAGLIPAIST